MTRPFILFYTPRSGETVLTRLMRGHSDVVLRPRLFDKNSDLPNDGGPQTPEAREAFVTKMWAGYHTGRKMDRARGLSVAVINRRTDLDRDEPIVDHMVSLNPAVIVLRRDNWVHQSLDQTVLNTDATDGLPMVDPEQIEASLTRVRQGYVLLDRIIAPFGPVLEIAFEELVTERDETLDRVLRYIGLGGSDHTPDAKAPVAQEVGDIDTVLGNPDVLRAALKDTDYDGSV